MSLTSLRGYANLASSALDTARSTFKAMADAAVHPDAAAGVGGGRAAAAGAGGASAGAAGAASVGAGVAGGASAGAESKTVRKPEAAVSTAAEPSAGQPRKGARRGVALDAYA